MSRRVCRSMPGLPDAVDRIIKLGTHDPEAAHSAEDQLLRGLVNSWAPPDVVAETTVLADADFPRWRA